MLKRIFGWIGTAPRWQTFLVFSLLFAGSYILINHFPIFDAHKLPFLPGENQIPLMNWTVYIYLSIFIYIPIAIYLIPQERYARTFLALCAMCALHLIIFVIFPTIYPRAPIDDEYLLIRLIRIVDAPTNCFPSLHVALSMFFAIALLRTRKDKISVVMFVWAVFIALSTVTTQQHYILDGLGALVTSIFFSFVI